jgi:CheY-like chemotaxis protein
VHVLVVDDRADERELLAAILERHGARVSTADSARAALQILGDARPDVLISDIAMPDEDGYATLKRIRRWEAGNALRGCRPAIALSAFTQREDRIRALSEGFQMHLTKPVAPAELVTVIASVARGMRM